MLSRAEGLWISLCRVFLGRCESRPVAECICSLAFCCVFLDATYYVVRLRGWMGAKIQADDEGLCLALWFVWPSIDHLVQSPSILPLAIVRTHTTSDAAKESRSTYVFCTSEPGCGGVCCWVRWDVDGTERTIQAICVAMVRVES